MQSPKAAQAASQAGKTLWQAYVQQRGNVGLSLPSSKSLWDVVNRRLFEAHGAEAVRDIWVEYHADPSKNRTASVMSGAKYLKFAENANKSPMFVLPVFKGPNAFETFMVQCQLPLVLLTTLEEYKQRGPGAQPHMVLTHYPELMTEKGIVLVRGDIIHPEAVSRFEAEALTRQLYDFYTDDKKHAFVHAFNHRQADFDYKKMLDSLMHDTSQLEK